MHDEKAQCLLGAAPLAVFDLHLAAYALAMPASGRFSLGPPWFLHQQRQGALLLAPGFKVLPYGTRTRDSRDEIDLVLQP